MSTVLVIGGAGCLGSAVAARAHADGHTVRSLDLVPCDVTGVEDVVGDLRDPAARREALDSVDVVYHCAAHVSMHPLAERVLWEINVQGTRDLLEAARHAGVRSFVYAGSQAVALSQSVPCAGVDESRPMSSDPPSQFGAGRCEAERDVVSANDRRMRTCVVRIPILYGPRERFNLPALLSVANSGPIPRLGKQGARCASMYRDNAAHALMLAGAALEAGRFGGKAWFASDQDPPDSYWDLMDDLLVASGFPPTKGRIPVLVLRPMVRVIEGFSRRFPHMVKGEPILSRESIAAVGQDAWFDCSAIRRDLGFAPIVGRADAVRTTAAWYANNQARGWHWNELAAWAESPPG